MNLLLMEQLLQSNFAQQDITVQDPLRLRSQFLLLKMEECVIQDPIVQLELQHLSLALLEHLTIEKECQFVRLALLDGPAQLVLAPLLNAQQISIVLQEAP